jgi:transposase
LTSIYNRVVRTSVSRVHNSLQGLEKKRGIDNRSFPTPEKIMEMGVDKIVETWRKQMKRASLKRAERLVKAKQKRRLKWPPRPVCKTC